MWQGVARGNIQQISYISQTEQHLPFGLMLLRLGNVTIICMTNIACKIIACNITRAGLTVCEVGVFSREISQLLKICPLPFLWSYLSSLPMGVFSRNYCTRYAICP